MRRSIICIIIITSLVLCSTSLAFANPLDPWSGAQANTVTNGVVSIDNKLSNIYTGLSALYNYLKNNGDGVVEGLLVLANRVSNIINTLDYYLPLQNSVLQNLYSFFVPPSGDQRDIWDLLSQISANTTATSTALNTTNSELLTIDSHIDGVEGSLTSIGGKLDTVNVNIDEVETKLGTSNTLLYNVNGFLSQIYDTLNITSEPVYSYYDAYFNQTSNPKCLLYPYSGYINLTTWNSKYFRPLFVTDYGLIFDIYFPIPDNIDISDLSVSTHYPNADITNIFMSNDINNFLTSSGPTADVINLSDFDVTYEIVDNTLIGHYDFSEFDFLLNYKYFLVSSVAPQFSSNSFTSIDFTGLTPYYILSDGESVNLINAIYEELKNNNYNVTLEDIKNILIDIDNNSDFIQNNNDLEINVDIDAADGVAITGVINKLKTLFSTGVGLSQFLLSLNEFDNLLWFTSLETYQQVNYNPNVPGNGYQDLYD